VPKMKTHSGTKKRVKMTGKGKLRRQRANRRHLLEHKASKRTRRLDQDADISKADTKQVKRLLGKR